MRASLPTVLLLACLSACSTLRPTPGIRYRVGVSNSTKSFLDEQKQPAGLYVEVFRAAAKRAGLSYDFVWLTGQPDDAVAQGLVDFHVALVNTAARRKKALYFSEPWWESPLVIGVHSDSPVRRLTDLRGLTVAFWGSDGRYDPVWPSLSGVLPQEMPTRKAAFESICAGQVSAILLVGPDAEQVFAKPPAVCGDIRFRFLRLPAQRMRYSLTSQTRHQALCDRLNREIQAMAEEGTLEQLVSPWLGLHSSAAQELGQAIATRRRQERVMMLAIGVVTILLGMLLWRERRTLRRMRLLQERTGQAENRFRDLFESPLMAVFVVECPGSRIVAANPAFYRLLGLTQNPAEPLILDHLVAHRPPHERAALKDLGSNPQQGPVRTEFRLDAGLSVPVMVATAFAKSNAGPETTEVLAVALDATPLKQVRELAGQLLAVEDRERRRIARELHDSTAQKLASLIMLLDLTVRTGEYQEIRALASGALDELRSFSYLLHPPFLDELGLPVALRTYLGGFESRSGISVDANIPEQISALPPDTSLALFRIVQESLTNIQRHSRSHWVSVKLSQQGDQLRLTVRDGGPAAQPQQASAGMGIRGMQERARHLGGSLDVRIGETGTTVRAVLPVTEA